MKNIKKIVAMVLAVVMMLTMVTGCKKEEHDQTSCTDPAHDHTTEAAATTMPATKATEAPTKAEKIEYASVVYLSVNPRFAIYYDAEGKVVTATAENDDGKALDMDLAALTEKAAAEAVVELLDAIYQAGYFNDGENTIELTFFGETESIVADITTLSALEMAIYEATEDYVEKNEIKVTVAAKQSPEATALKPADSEKLSDSTTAATKPTEAPTTSPATNPTTPNPTEAPATITPESTHQHNYRSDTVKPTCTEGGYTEYTCKDCGHSYTDNKTDKLGHDVEKKVVKATYESGGYTEYTCKRCGYSYRGEETAPLPKPTEVKPPATTAPSNPSDPAGPTTPSVECPYCGGPHYLYECPVAKEDIENKEPEPIKCGYCGTTDCDYPATGDATLCPQYDEKKDATKYCQTCGESVSICHRYTVDTDCHYCGVPVPAWTCHYC